MVSPVDNFIRPKLCGSRMAMHPMLVFLSMFGGLAVFGAMGLLVGPLIAAIFMSMVRIYRRDFLEVGEASAPVPTTPPPPPARSEEIYRAAGGWPASQALSDSSGLPTCTSPCCRPGR